MLASTALLLILLVLGGDKGCCLGFTPGSSRYVFRTSHSFRSYNSNKVRASRSNDEVVKSSSDSKQGGSSSGGLSSKVKQIASAANYTFLEFEGVMIS